MGLRATHPSALPDHNANSPVGRECWALWGGVSLGHCWSPQGWAWRLAVEVSTDLLNGAETMTDSRRMLQKEDGGRRGS